MSMLIHELLCVEAILPYICYMRLILIRLLMGKKYDLILISLPIALKFFFFKWQFILNGLLIKPASELK